MPSIKRRPNAITPAQSSIRRELAEIGIDTAEKFGKVIHAAQSLTSSRQIKALEAKRDAARKAKRTTKRCSQFINHGHVKQKKRN